MNFQQWQDFNNADLSRSPGMASRPLRASAERDRIGRQSSRHRVSGSRGIGGNSARIGIACHSPRAFKFETEVLFLCAAMEFDPGTATRCAMAAGNAAQPFATFALAMRLFDAPDWNALTADRPLRYSRLIEINQPGSTPLTAAALRADERIVNFLKGLNTLDDRIVPLLMPFDAAGDVPLAPSHEAQAEDLSLQLDRAAQTDESERLPWCSLPVLMRPANNYWLSMWLPAWGLGF